MLPAKGVGIDEGQSCASGVLRFAKAKSKCLRGMALLATPGHKICVRTDLSLIPDTD